MTESLDEVKKKLGRLFLGKAGIHGFGVSRTENAIRVYVSSNVVSETPDMLKLLRESAKPFPIIIVEEERPELI